MSKQVEVSVKCGVCGKNFPAKLYRSLWIEDPQNRSRVYNDEINSVTCAHCKQRARINFPFLCTNVKKGIAIWYEPYHDEAIDNDIRQYSTNFGKDSFYAKAPRIRDWEEFKKVLAEMEREANLKTEDIEISEKLMGQFSGFVGSLRSKNTSKGQLHKYLSHLGSIKKRFAYSLLPFLFLITMGIPSRGLARQLDALWNDKGEVLLVFVGVTAITFALLSALHAAVLEYKPWSDRSPSFRNVVFASGCWVVATLLYVVLLDPYEVGSWSYMESEEYTHMLMSLLLPPAFLCAAIFIYEKYVKTNSTNTQINSERVDSSAQKTSTTGGTDFQKFQVFTQAMSRLGAANNSEAMRAISKSFLAKFESPYVAAMEAHGTLMKIMVQSGKMNPSALGSAIAVATGCVCEFVLEEKISMQDGRKYFDVFTSLSNSLLPDGHKLPAGMLGNFDTWLEMHRERRGNR